MNPVSQWLEPFSWEFVIAQNEILCQKKNAHHGPTSDGHVSGKDLWEASRSRTISLFEAVEICRKCHRLAPFTNFNGNTFAAIARILIRRLELEPEEESVVRSIVGHIVAGVASEEEVRAFEKFCASLG